MSSTRTNARQLLMRDQVMQEAKVEARQRGNNNLQQSGGNILNNSHLSVVSSSSSSGMVGIGGTSSLATTASTNVPFKLLPKSISSDLIGHTDILVTKFLPGSVPSRLKRVAPPSSSFTITNQQKGEHHPHSLHQQVFIPSSFQIDMNNFQANSAPVAQHVLQQQHSLPQSAFDGLFDDDEMTLDLSNIEPFHVDEISLDESVNCAIGESDYATSALLTNNTNTPGEGAIYHENKTMATTTSARSPDCESQLTLSYTSGTPQSDLRSSMEIPSQSGMLFNDLTSSQLETKPFSASRGQPFDQSPTITASNSSLFLKTTASCPDNLAQNDTKKGLLLLLTSSHQQQNTFGLSAGQQQHFYSQQQQTSSSSQQQHLHHQHPTLITSIDNATTTTQLDNQSITGGGGGGGNVVVTSGANRYRRVTKTPLSSTAPFAGKNDRHKKDIHNQVEKKRRGLINQNIDTLGMIVPTEFYKDGDKRSKGSILAATVNYISFLKRGERENQVLYQEAALATEAISALLSRCKNFQQIFNQLGISGMNDEATQQCQELLNRWSRLHQEYQVLQARQQQQQQQQQNLSQQQQQQRGRSSMTSQSSSIIMSDHPRGSPTDSCCYTPMPGATPMSNWTTSPVGLDVTGTSATGTGSGTGIRLVKASPGITSSSGGGGGGNNNQRGVLTTAQSTQPCALDLLKVEPSSVSSTDACGIDMEIGDDYYS